MSFDRQVTKAEARLIEEGAAIAFETIASQFDQREGEVWTSEEIADWARRAQVNLAEKMQELIGGSA